MKLVKHGKNRIGMVNIELYTTMTLRDWLERELDKAYGGGSTIIASIVAHPNPENTGRNAKIIEDTGKVVMFEINVSCPMPAGQDGVGFQILVAAESAEQPVVLMDETVTSNVWEWKTLPLVAFYGQDLVLQLKVDSLGDYSYDWLQAVVRMMPAADTPNQ